MLINTPRVFLGIVFLIVGIGYVIRVAHRRHDPLDYAAWNVAYEPRMSVLYFEGMRQYDPLSYDDLVHSIKDYSRLYQTTFLSESRIHEVVKDMAIQRRLMHRHAHTLRHHLPNSLHLEKRVLLGIEHTDGAMASMLADTAQRFPEIRLLYGAGMKQAPIRAADDVWEA